LKRVKPSSEKADGQAEGGEVGFDALPPVVQFHRVGEAGAFQAEARKGGDAGGVLEDALDEAEAAFGDVQHVGHWGLLGRKGLLFSEEKRSKKDFIRLRPRAFVPANG
jgi:hypothetical protein